MFWKLIFNNEKTLPKKISKKIVNYGISQLKLAPQYHDKIEFEISNPSFAFDSKEKISTYNLGNEIGVSVKKIINTISSTLKKDAKLKIVSRRNGDVSRLVCSSKKIFKLIRWKPKNSKIQKIINDEIMWQKYLTKKNIKKRMVY